MDGIYHIHFIPSRLSLTINQTVDAIKLYRVPEEDELYYKLDADGVKTGNLRAFPPPSFGRQNVAQIFT